VTFWYGSGSSDPHLWLTDPDADRDVDPDIFYGGLEIVNWNFWSIKYQIFFSAVSFIQFLVIKTLDPNWIRIWFGIKPKMLNPDQQSSIPDPWHLVRIRILGSVPLTNGYGCGSGSGSFSFRQWPSRCQQKKKKFLKFFMLTYSFLNIHLHHSSKIKSHKEITKQKKSRFFFIFLLVIGNTG
jgi:hypothetical protein